MFNRLFLTAFFLVCCFACSVAGAQDSRPKKNAANNKAEKDLLRASDRLANSVTDEGDGWEEYESLLHPKFNRWSSSNQVGDRKSSVAGIKDWWNDGNRKKNAESKVISIQVVGSTGVIRKKVKEIYFDSAGKQSGTFEGYVTAVWVKDDHGWKILSASIQRIE